MILDPNVYMLVPRMLCNKYMFYDLLLVNYTWHSLLTAADVRCAVASTRKKANWTMSCMVSERSHCSSEVQYILNQSVATSTQTHTEVLLPVLLRIWFSGLFLSLCAVGVIQHLQVCLLVQTESIWSAYLEWCCFYTQKLIPPLAGISSPIFTDLVSFQLALTYILDLLQLISCWDSIEGLYLCGEPKVFRCMYLFVHRRASGQVMLFSYSAIISLPLSLFILLVH